MSVVLAATGRRTMLCLRNRLVILCKIKYVNPRRDTLYSFLIPLLFLQGV